MGFALKYFTLHSEEAIPSERWSGFSHSTSQTHPRRWWSIKPDARECVRRPISSLPGSSRWWCQACCSEAAHRRGWTGSKARVSPNAETPRACRLDPQGSIYQRNNVVRALPKFLLRLLASRTTGCWPVTGQREQRALTCQRPFRQRNCVKYPLYLSHHLKTDIHSSQGVTGFIYFTGHRQSISTSQSDIFQMCNINLVI